MRLTGSFQTTTTQRGESRGSSPIRSTRTGSGARVTDVPTIGGIVPQRRRTRESAASGDARLEPELRDGLLDLRGEARRVEPDQPTQVADGAMVDEPIGRDPEDAHADVAERRIRAPRLLERLKDGRPEAACRHALLEGDDEPLAARRVQDQVPV